MCFGLALISILLVGGARVRSLTWGADSSVPGAAPQPMAASASHDPGEASIETRTFVSTALGRRTMPYAVYLPPGYADGTVTRYPVLYMLHGMGGSFRTWQDYGLTTTADRLIRAGAIAPLIIVMPEGEAAYWVDHANGGPRWGSYVAQDLVAEVDARYRTVAQRQARAVGGQSMGAHGALQLAMNHPSVFAVVGAHSIALRRHPQAPAYFGDDAAFNQRDPIWLCARFPELARTFAIWLDIGEEDTWTPAAAGLHRQLDESGVPHRWTIWPGGHNADYWTGHSADYLHFYNGALTVD